MSSVVLAVLFFSLYLFNVLALTCLDNYGNTVDWWVSLKHSNDFNYTVYNNKTGAFDVRQIDFCLVLLLLYEQRILCFSGPALSRRWFGNFGLLCCANQKIECRSKSISSFVAVIYQTHCKRCTVQPARIRICSPTMRRPTWSRKIRRTKRFVVCSRSHRFVSFDRVTAI